MTVHVLFCCQETVYTFGPTGPDAVGTVPPPDEDYRKNAVRIAHQRAALAANRLALVMDAALAR